MAATAADLFPVLAAYHGTAPSLATVPALAALAQRLGRVSSVMLVPGAAACTDYRLSKLLVGPRAIVLHKRLDTLIGPGLGALHDYEALAFGYHAEGGKAVVLVGFAYATHAQAVADVEPRSQVAERGLRLSGQRPIAELFTLASATAEEQTLVLRLTSVRGRLPLYEMMARCDMLLAACPR